MRILLINLAVNTQDNRFHNLGINGKFELIENCIESFSPYIERMRILDESPFKAMLVAPEYFFARCCPETGGRGHRHYEYADYIKIRQKLSSMSSRYPDILFVPGTIAWKSPIVKGELAPIPSFLAINTEAVPAWKSREYNSEQDFYRSMIKIGEVTERGVPTKNWATYLREAPDRDLFTACELLKSKYANFSGGRALSANEKIKILYNKVMDQGLSQEKYIKNMSAAMNDISFVRNTAFFYLNGRKVGEYTKHSDYQETFFQIFSSETAIALNDMGPSILDICGVKIGVEICYDHACGILKHAVTMHPSLMPDVHLILSATVANSAPLAGPTRIHSSITSVLDRRGNTQLPIANPQELIGFTTFDRLAVFESVPVDIPVTFANIRYGNRSSAVDSVLPYPSVRAGANAYSLSGLFAPSRLLAQDIFNRGMENYTIGNNEIARECFSKIVRDYSSLQFSSRLTKHQLIQASTRILQEMSPYQVFGIAR